MLTIIVTTIATVHTTAMASTTPKVQYIKMDLCLVGKFLKFFIIGDG